MLHWCTERQSHFCFPLNNLYSKTLCLGLVNIYRAVGLSLVSADPCRGVLGPRKIERWPVHIHVTMMPDAVAIALYKGSIFKRSKFSLQLAFKINLAAQWSGRVGRVQTKQLPSVFDLSQLHVLCGMRDPISVATFLKLGGEDLLTWFTAECILLLIAASKVCASMMFFRDLGDISCVALVQWSDYCDVTCEKNAP